MKVLAWIVAVGLMVVCIYPLCVTDKIIDHKKVSCLSNIKQLATANLIYQADHDDRFPLRDNWMDSVDQFAKMEHLFHCPELIKSPPSSNLYGYCFNRRLSGAKEPVNPEKVELVFDSINLAKNASGTQESLPKPGRHNGKNIIAYEDGHAKTVVNP